MLRISIRDKPTRILRVRLIDRLTQTLTVQHLIRVLPITLRDIFIQIKIRGAVASRQLLRGTACLAAFIIIQDGFTKMPYFRVKNGLFMPFLGQNT